MIPSKVIIFVLIFVQLLLIISSQSEDWTVITTTEGLIDPFKPTLPTATTDTDIRTATKQPTLETTGQDTKGLGSSGSGTAAQTTTYQGTSARGTTEQSTTEHSTSEQSTTEPATTKTEGTEQNPPESYTGSQCGAGCIVGVTFGLLLVACSSAWVFYTYFYQTRHYRLPRSKSRRMFQEVGDDARKIV